MSHGLSALNMIKFKNLPHHETFPINFASIKASINLIAQLENSPKMFVFQKKNTYS